MAIAIKSNAITIRKELRLTHAEIIQVMKDQGLDIGNFQALEVSSSLNGSFDQFRFTLGPGDEVVFGFLRFRPAEDEIIGEGPICPPETTT